MKAIVITTDDTISIRDFSEPLHESMGAAVGGMIEIVQPIGLLMPYCMIVNKEGFTFELPYNRMGSLLYGMPIHGSLIAGDIVIAKTGFTTSGPDIVPFEEDELEHLYKLLKDYELTPVEDGERKGEKT